VVDIELVAEDLQHRRGELLSDQNYGSGHARRV
jgi:hypothetical protein